MPLCNLDDNRSRRLCLGIIFSLFIFFLFARWGALADSISVAVDSVNLKIAGSFFISLVVIPILIIQADTDARCMCHPSHFEEKGDDSAIGKFCSYWNFVFAGVAFLGALLYLIGGFVDVSNAQGVPEIGLLFFTLPTYVFFHTCLVIADFLREVLQDRWRRIIILSGGLFFFGLFVFCAVARFQDSSFQAVAAATFFMWFFTMLIIIARVMSVTLFDNNQKIFDLVTSGMLAFGGFLFFCGFCAIASTISPVSSSGAFFYVIWGMFVASHTFIVAYDIICDYGFFELAQSTKSAESAAPEYGNQDGEYGNAGSPAPAAGDLPPPSYVQSQIDYGMAADDGDINIADGDIQTGQPAPQSAAGAAPGPPPGRPSKPSDPRPPPPAGRSSGAKPPPPAQIR